MMASNCTLHTYTYQPPQDHDLKLATSSSLAPSLSCAAIRAQRARKSRDLSRNGNRGTDAPKLTLSFDMLQNPAESHAHKRHGEKPYTCIYLYIYICIYIYILYIWLLIKSLVISEFSQRLVAGDNFLCSPETQIQKLADASASEMP